MITTMMVTRDDAARATRTLRSVKGSGPALVGDLGSKDGTRGACEGVGAEVIDLTFRYDYSSARNELMSRAGTEWVLWLNPGEEVESGVELLSAEKSDEMYRVMVLNGDLLTKETRLMKRTARFKNRVFEEVVGDVSGQTLPVVVSGSTSNDRFVMDCLMRWRDEEPLSPEPDYYTACFHLTHGNREEFMAYAGRFLFNGKSGDSSKAMTKYYMSHLLKKDDPGRALKLALECLASFPLMAEFWCLLGDIHLFGIRQYDRAYHFYENATILGSRRLAEDTMPTEISKYEEYPRKMMDAIRSAITRTLKNS